MKREEIKEGEIYIYNYDDGDFEIFRARATKDLKWCRNLSPWDKQLRHIDYRETLNNNNKVSTPTQEQIIWFEYCESVSEYRELEEALDNYYTKEFVREYLNEL